MDSSNLHPLENKRLSDRHQEVIHETSLEPSFSDLTRIAGQLLSAPQALFGFSDGDRFLLKSGTPFGAGDASALTAILSCARDAKDFFVVEDTSRDPLFLNAPILV